MSPGPDGKNPSEIHRPVTQLRTLSGLAAAGFKCRVADVKSLSVLHHAYVIFIFISL